MDMDIEKRFLIFHLFFSLIGYENNKLGTHFFVVIGTTILYFHIIFGFIALFG